MHRHLVLAAVITLSLPAGAVADVDSYHVYSLEWLVDASDSVQMVSVEDEPGATPRSADIDVVRRAACESLRKLRVEVPRPALEHRARVPR